MQLIYNFKWTSSSISYTNYSLTAITAKIYKKRKKLIRTTAILRTKKLPIILNIKNWKEKKKT